MGQAAVRLFLQLGQELKNLAPQHVVLQPELCIRASSLRNA
jgi:DNA-binding LacI/PurR family transcriptional regulator